MSVVGILVCPEILFDWLLLSHLVKTYALLANASREWLFLLHLPNVVSLLTKKFHQYHILYNIFNLKPNFEKFLDNINLKFIQP